MPLTKTPKLWLWILSIPVALILLCIIGLKLYLTSDRLKSMVVPPIEDATHRTFAVREISFSVFPTFNLTIDGLSISNPYGSKFDEEKFVSFEKLVLDVKLFALLSDRLEVSTMTLKHPRIFMEVAEDGTKNYGSKEVEQAVCM